MKSLEKTIGLTQEELLITLSFDKNLWNVFLKVSQHVASLCEEELAVLDRERSTLCDEIRQEIAAKIQLLPPDELLRVRRFAIEAFNRVQSREAAT